VGAERLLAALMRPPSENRKTENADWASPLPPPFFVTAHSKGLTETRFRNCAF